MKTIETIQNQVIETIRPALDNYAKRIGDFWEKGWNIQQEALRTYKNSEYYINEMARAEKDYNSHKNLWSKILSGEYISRHTDREIAVKEAEVAYARNEEGYPRRKETIANHALALQYSALCGYIRDVPSTRRKDSPAELKNKDIVASGILMIGHYCNAREEFQTKRDQEIKLTLESSVAKLKNQIEKKFANVQNINSFEKYSFYLSEKGYVGEWRVETSEKSYLFKTQCIDAGGYNIQQYHVRYIANLKPIK